MRWLLLFFFLCAIAGPAEGAAVRGSVGERTYRVVVPEGGGADVRRPVVVVLHVGGDRESGATIAAQTGFDAEARARGWIAVYPDARGGRFQVDGFAIDRRPWPTPREELAFVRRVVARVGDRHRIDRARIVATGFSNGGFLAYALACEREPLVRAIAVVGTTETLRRCGAAKAERAVSVLHVHARDDATLPLARGIRGWPSPLQTVRRWRTRHRCTGWRGVESSGVTRWNATRCRENALVAFTELHAGGHGWPAGLTTEIGTFLSATIASRRIAQ
ncbi:MAG TPA: PHB depolymerase family esterase [Solirubrobacteraceae bacterium]|nr:PHB depolymerase family esterase [Solirubrobacteraceae bacterium]